MSAIKDQIDEIRRIDCPECGHPVDEWCDCPSCGWLDYGRWKAELEGIDDDR